ncbi:spermidine synthase [Strigomonas culicis]|uniref:Spermidine synthase n=1 Tax=Strigomonas culicis TaxID=28005 RepID=S9UBL7_9TRYP|nr:spermidine synthase [Strigomonas culicis]|eukprot:EPY26094.1 spermidine synthase [Strigomonas culicis]
MTLDGAIQSRTTTSSSTMRCWRTCRSATTPSRSVCSSSAAATAALSGRCCATRTSSAGIVERIELVDIDGAVIEQSKIHFPQIACGYADPCVTAKVGDGIAFVRDAPDNTYDVIIIDTTDPEGPASELFGLDFYSNVKRILRPGGIVCNQGESVWMHRPLIEKMLHFLRQDVGFASVQYALIYIPTYPCGSIGTLVCAKDAGHDLTVPLRPVEAITGTAQERFHEKLKYYSSDMHKASFVLPRFAAYLNDETKK